MALRLKCHCLLTANNVLRIIIHVDVKYQNYTELSCVLECLYARFYELGIALHYIKSVTGGNVLTYRAQSYTA